MQVTTLLNRLRLVDGAGDGAVAPSPRALARARVDALPPGARARLGRVLNGCAGAAQRERLHQAVAAGHPVATVQRLARRLAPLTPAEQRRRTRLVDSGPGPARIGPVPLAQLNGTTCGPAVVMVTRASVDPIYAWWLTTGDAGEVAERLAAEQRRIHAYANLLWPRMLGTTPWGVVAALNGRVAPRGVRYAWRMVDGADPASAGAALRQAVAAVTAGYAVPVLVGQRVPRHWVLLTGLRRRDGDVGELTFYNPAGTVVRVPATDLLAGRSTGLGYPHPQAVVLPRPSKLPTISGNPWDWSAL